MILILRLFMTPLLIGAATLAGRRWGPGISGWLIGFPLTSAPVSLLLALQYGRAFAARAAIGNLAGLASICAFSLAYGAVARKQNWLVSAVLASLAFVVATWIWNNFTLSLPITFIIVVGVIGLVLWLIPLQMIASDSSQTPRWDLPARMIIAGAFVIALTAWAPVLGPQLSGLITPFPVFGTVLSAFAHRQQGADAAVQLLRGMTLNLLGVAAFFLIVGGLLTSLEIAWTYIVAAMTTLVISGIALRLARYTVPHQFSE